MTGRVSRVLYLATPIDQAAPVPMRAAEDAALAALEAGWAVYRPQRAWQVPKVVEPFVELDAANRAVLDRAGALLAFLPPGVPSVGVPREIEYAVARGIPVRKLHDNDETASWALADVECVDNGTGVTNWLERLATRHWSESHRVEVTEIESQAEQFLPAQEPMPILFHVGANGTMPSRFYMGDAGYDLYTSENCEIPLGEFRDLSTQVRVALPPGVWARICGRSSTLRNFGLLTAEGVIDTGYRGELFVGVQNIGQGAIQLARGSRIAQLIPHSNITPDLRATRVDWGRFQAAPSVDDRGSNGFGSTSVESS